MELDDFKNKRRHSGIIATDNENVYKKSVDDLIVLFKSHEKKMKRKTLTVIAFLTALAAIYLSIVSQKAGLSALGYFIIVIGLFLGALYLFLRYKPLTPQNYSLPMKEFLDELEKKTSYFYYLTDYLIVVILLLILGTGGGLVFITSLLKYTDNVVLLLILWTIFFLSLSVFGFWAGRKNWKKENGDFLEKIIEIKNSYSENTKSKE